MHAYLEKSDWLLYLWGACLSMSHWETSKCCIVLGPAESLLRLRWPQCLHSMTRHDCANCFPTAIYRWAIMRIAIDECYSCIICWAVFELLGHCSEWCSIDWVVMHLAQYYLAIHGTGSRHLQKPEASLINCMCLQTLCDLPAWGLVSCLLTKEVEYDSIMHWKVWSPCASFLCSRKLQHGAP